jgi:hypothetical protein
MTDLRSNTGTIARGDMAEDIKAGHLQVVMPAYPPARFALTDQNAGQQNLGWRFITFAPP